MKTSLDQYEKALQDEFPEGLLPMRAADHDIEIEKGSKPPHRPLYQLSPMGLQADKEYADDFVQKGKIRPSNSPYGVLIFFIKEKDKPLRVVVDYRSLNRMTKRNNAPLPRSDKMFEMLGGAEVCYK